MSVRTPLPIGLIKSRHVNRTASTYKSIGAKERGMNSNPQHEYDRFVSAYKPSALPFFAKSQLSQFNSSKELFTLPSLRAIGSNESINHVYTRGDNNNNNNSSINSKIQLFPQPSDEDSSDALLTRVKDAYAPGRNPHYIALPIPSTLLLSHTTNVLCNNNDNSSRSIPVSVTSESDTSIHSPYSNSYTSDQTKFQHHHNNNSSVHDTNNSSDNGQDVHHTNNFLHHSQLKFNNVSESTAALSTPAGINQWTSRWKGLTLLASDVATTSVIRNCAAMKLVSTTYRVLCRLPAGVSWNITQHLQSANKVYTEKIRVHSSTATDRDWNTVSVNDTCTNKSIACKKYHHRDDDNNYHNVIRNTVSLASRNSNKASRFMNPYVNEFIVQKEQNDDSCVDTNEIPLYDIVTGSLPNDLVIEPLLSMNAMGTSSNTVSATTATQRIKSNTVSPHMEYGFVNYERNTLRSRGVINCVLRSRASSLSREFDERVNQRRRLQGLFLPNTNMETHKVNVNKAKILKSHPLQISYSKIENNNNSSIAANDDDDDGTQITQNYASYNHEVSNNNSNKYHPWLPESSLLSLSLDVASVTKSKGTSNTERSLHHSQNKLNVPQRGKHVAFDFRLLTIAPMNSVHTKENIIRGSSENFNVHNTHNGHSYQDVVIMDHTNDEAECNDCNIDDEESSRVITSSSSEKTISLSELEKLECCYALYEVTGMNLTPDEVAAVFAAQHFYVLNDYVNDVALAESIADVAERIRSTSLAWLTKNNLSLSAQHFIKNGSVEELVIIPLMQQPLVRAANCIIHKAHEQEELKEALQQESEEEEEEKVEKQIEQTRKIANESITRHTKQIIETTNTNEINLRKTKKSNRNGATALRQNEMNVHQPRHNSLHEQLLFEALHAHMSTSNNANNCHHNNDVFFYGDEMRNNTYYHNKNNFINKKGDTKFKSLLHLLPLGSGVECVEIVFPDPTLHSNLLTLQRLYQEFQESSSDYTHNKGKAKAIESLVFVSHNIHNSILTNGEDGICEVPMVLGATMQNFAQVRFLDSVQTREENRNNRSNNVITTNHVMRNCVLPFPTLPSIECSTSLAIPLLMNFTTWYGAHWLVKQLRRVHTSCSYEGEWQKWVKAVEREVLTTTSSAPASVDAMSLLYTNWIWCIRDHLSCFLRLEELSEHICALCHEQGHTWRSCPLHLGSSEFLIEESVTSKSIGKEQKESSSLVAIAGAQSSLSSLSSMPTSSEATKPGKKVEEKFDLITDGMTVHSIEDVAHELNTSLTNHYHNTNNAYYTYDNHSSLQRHNHKVSHTSRLSTVVNVPNKALTYTSRQARYEQNQYYREQANRFKPRHQQAIKIIRCVYCGGRHHISECGKLDKQN